MMVGVVVVERRPAEVDQKARRAATGGEVERAVSLRAVIIGWTNRGAIFRARSAILFARRRGDGEGDRVSVRRLVRLDSPTAIGILADRARRQVGGRTMG